jgi:RNA polymerase sigma-70 factor, ECF subfamily
MAREDMSADGSGCNAEPSAPTSDRHATRVIAIAATGDSAERELMRQSLEGDREAFGQLATLHEAGLYRYLLRMLRNPDDAADQTQEAFLTAWRNLRMFDPGRPFRPWLYRIATNQTISLLRKRGHIVELSIDKDSAGDLAALATSAPSPDQLAEAAELVRTLRRAMGCLPPLVAAAMHLKYEEGKSMPEIAEILGKSPGAVAVLIHRARTKLRDMIYGARGTPLGEER